MTSEEVAEEPQDGEVSGADDDEGVVPVQFVQVVMALPSTHPIVVLQESDAPYRELRIPIGLPEGTAIAFATEGVASPRPLTHDLFASALTKLGCRIEVVRLTGLRASTYLAELELSTPTGRLVLEARPSDALALALRERPHPPITVAKAVLQAMGITSR
jgi:uncharacterized protein